MKVTLDFFLFFQGAFKLQNPILGNFQGMQYSKEEGKKPIKYI